MGSDHAGFTLKNEIFNYLKSNQIEVIDMGCYSSESVDYPDYAEKVCQKVQQGDALGILVCYTGIGMSITANKFHGIRAALVSRVDDAKLTREHNNANVLCLSEKNTSFNDSKEIVDTFLSTKFLGETKDGSRHLRRVSKIERIDNENK